MIRRVVVERIVRLGRVAKAFRALSLLALTYGLLGIALYLTMFPSDLILIDSILWIIDALTYLSLFVILSAVYAKAARRYELLRVEDVVSLLLSLMTLAITVYLIPSSLAATGVTPLPLSSFLVVSGILSYAMSVYVKRSGGGRMISVVASTVAKRTLLDTLVEFAGAASIILSNLTGLAVVERLTFLGLSAYAIRYSVGIAREALLNLLGINVPAGVRRRVFGVLKSYYGIRARRVVLRRLGSFVEGELWVELPDSLPLITAQSVVLRLAREVVGSVPELVRVLVIALPSRKVVGATTPPLATAIPRAQRVENPSG